MVQKHDHGLPIEGSAGQDGEARRRRIRGPHLWARRLHHAYRSQRSQRCWVHEPAQVRPEHGRPATETGDTWRPDHASSPLEPIEGRLRLSSARRSADNQR
jgi:hypothetical protein